MAFIINDPSRTFAEYLLIPGLTTKEHRPENVSLSTPMARYRRGEEDAPLAANIPLVSAVMQSVSDDSLAVALARMGGVSFIYCSQPIGRQADMVRRVKDFKAGFVVSTANIKPDSLLSDVVALIERTGHSTIPVTEDGTSHGRLLGLLTGRDFRPHKTDLSTPVTAVMTPFEKLVCGTTKDSLSDANELIWQHKLNCLPIVDANQRLCRLVFRKDYDAHRENPDEFVDSKKRLVVGAGINSRDHMERVPALLDAGADILCVDSSDGYTEWQGDAIREIKAAFGKETKIGGGNVVDAEGFRYLADRGADFVKVGIGPASICITREQKGIGRGQATSVIEVAAARDAYFKETGEYVPICSDGGITQDYHMTLALAMGADFVMLGRYFARFDESPGRKLWLGGKPVKEYWAEGSNRARNWQRYDVGGKDSLVFEEGVDACVPYVGSLKDNVAVTVDKMKSTFCNCGALTIPDFQQNAKLTLVSATSIREGGAHDVVLRDNDMQLHG